MVDKKKSKSKYGLSFWRFSFKRMDRVFKVIFFISLAAVLNYECRIIIRTSNADWLVGLNTVLVQVLYSYITGFIFYFLVEITQRNKRRIATFRLIHNNIFRINRCAEKIISEACMLTNTEIDSKITLKEFGSLCKTINTNSTQVVPYFLPRMTVKEFVLKMCDDIKGSTEGIINNSDLLEAEWINYLSNIDDSIWKIRQYLEINGSSATLDYCSAEIWQLYKESQKLEIANSEQFNSLKKMSYKVEGIYYDPELTFVYKGKV